MCDEIKVKILYLKLIPLLVLNKYGNLKTYRLIDCYTKHCAVCRVYMGLFTLQDVPSCTPREK